MVNFLMFNSCFAHPAWAFRITRTFRPADAQGSDRLHARSMTIGLYPHAGTAPSVPCPPFFSPSPSGDSRMRFRFAPLAAAIAMVVSTSASAYTNERGLDRKNFDESTPACTDFYQYANGNWLKTNPVPNEYSTWGISSELRERNLNLLKEIMEESAKTKAA